MARTIIPYAVARALAAAVLDCLEYRWTSRALSTEIYIALIACGSIALGIWAGTRLTPRTAPAAFARNDKAAESLGLTARECEILALLASGGSNKAIARALGISPNTVKTHVARVYEKLEVQNRIMALEKARSLALIP